MIVLRDISKHYGRVRANDGISLTLEPGRIYALVGENGAGKSTLMRILAGHTVPDSGAITLRDEEHPLEPYNLTEQSLVRSFMTKKDQAGEVQAFETEGTIEFKGRLIGGCMDCLVNLTGTKFDQVKSFNERYKEDGIIWYLESCDLNVFGIRRAIWQMIHAGWFEHVKGFLIGRPLHFGEEMIGLDQYHAVIDLLKEYQVPVLMDLDIGHLAPMMTLINGSTASVCAENGKVKINMELV